MILAAVAEHDCVAVTAPFMTTAQKSAARRAANRLEADGKIRLAAQRWSGGVHLVAYPIDAPNVPESRVVHGIDGKHYRMPN